MESIVNDPKFQKSLARIAKENNLELEVAQAEASEYIKELHAQQHPLTKLISVKGFDYLLSRAYHEKIDVDPEGIKKLMKLMRMHSVAFIMTHKTYLDTLVLISTLARFGMPVPYSFGGINLAFPGLKQIGNSAGIIFIRRSFKDNPVYKLSLRHYISTIINHGDHLTWNIEGTRSRTGKILHPQMGILKYIMDAEQESTKKIKYVPVSISYDLIPDVKEMTEQAKGESVKKSESVSEAIKYIRSLGNDFGRAAIRFGDPVEIDATHQVSVPHLEENSYQNKDNLPFFAFDLINEMSKITPVSTVSLICNVLLNDFALTKKEVEFKVKKLMEYIGKKRPNSLIDRGVSIAASVQKALNLLQSAHIVQKSRAGQKAQYSIVASEYLVATYYANMVAGHLYHSAFVEMALIKIKNDKSPDRIVHFWEEIMRLRNLFKFEFFYTNKAKFSDEIEAELTRFDKNWREILLDPDKDVTDILKKQDIFISRALLLSYLEADKVVCYTLNNWDEEDPFKEEEFLELCMFRGKELHWQSRITRLGSVSKPFLSSALQFAQNAGLGIKDHKVNVEGLGEWMEYLEDLTERLGYLKEIEIQPTVKSIGMLSTKEMLVPSAKSKPKRKEEKEEEGPHIAAYFDLDRTLINDFSVKRFLRTRLLSGDTTATEYLTQFMTAMFFSFGNRDFEFLSKVSALGVRGIPEKVFAELGQYVFDEFLFNTIYPEARELIKHHLEKGHKVVIISAATLYQINPIAKELGIEDIYGTRLEVQNGKFTGRIAEMCWGEGKARAARTFAKKNDIDLTKSYFYSDSFQDYPLFKIVGKPVATNPDNTLSQVAFENDWPILRFDKPGEKPIVDGLRTGLAAATIYPSAMLGVVKGLMTLSKQEAANTTFSTIGDLGTRFAGLQISVKGKRNLTDYRPAVFCFNHQSAADFFIIMKLLRNDFTGIAKKELERTPIGPVFKALGAIYIDRSNKANAIAAMKPAVEALKNGISIAIAPEGTRSGTPELGEFKKGAFHLAIQAGVPIVPIVIKNAYKAISKGSFMLHPTHIEVVVLDPVETALWKVKNIDKYVEEVRNMFVSELYN